jgi:uncharacterized protein (DUF2252 family)
MKSIGKAILDDNGGRDPERVTLKLAALRADPFSFFRGTCPLFYRSTDLAKPLRASPVVLVCGDMHLENFGSYKGDNRLVYFDLNDFDDACLAPVAYELLRVITSILVAAKSMKLGNNRASQLMAGFIDTYAANVLAGKARWVERPLATGPVKSLLQSLKGRHREDMIRARTQRKAGKIRLIIDGSRTLAATAADRQHAESILAAYASTQPLPASFSPVDIARRIAGNGSLGLERYVVLVRGDGSANGQYLLDIKFAHPSALEANLDIRQPRWRCEAERVVAIQHISQAISPALLGAVGAGKRSYVIKELQPSADRINIAPLRGKFGDLGDLVRTMAEVAAWDHLRTCGRRGASSVETFAAFAGTTEWRSLLMENAKVATVQVLQQWKEFSEDFDADRLRPQAYPARG